MVSFNIPVSTGKELDYLAQVIESRKLCGDGPLTKECSKWMEEKFGADKVLLTTSGTSALDMAFLLCDLTPEDEVILPSFTFSSTATAPLLANAQLVFTDIDPKTMNIDPDRIEQAITDKTKVILVMHYAGVACDMDRIMEIARKHNLIVVEDAAQGVMSSYKGKALGTIGDFGCYSFHETKNYSMGEGGAILINNPDYFERAEILREKGTDRSKFNRGQVDKYTWIDKGDSYLPSELNAAYLYPQLLMADEINNDRLDSWKYYYEKLKPLAEAGLIELGAIPEGAVHNAHMFYIKAKDIEERTELISYAKNHPEHPAQMVFHYIPLHSAPAGLKYGRFDGQDVYTTKESERLVRLPMYYGLSREEQDQVIANIMEFYGWKQN
ncbi:MAG: dTDP-4-amino-4,6-dideoxygalactose transaminase [Ileibacterium sp.]|nr:dTDP-4-amino-4,6-dideoxygalactose transaminase [Ileibacterium sp.]